MKIYITFGQTHAHRISGHTLDKDCVAVINCKDHTEGRKLAFEYFGPKFCTSSIVMSTESLNRFYPRGLIELN